ncbi:hypothetical protein ACIRSS_23630 [Amycolatopsis sp. NPDC101161]|uniref:hypothetical protein n=1 Tax=Amycolatopsis sp. NPDC101161 TaxID=3363940 RepID=UPI0038259223
MPPDFRCRQECEHADDKRTIHVHRNLWYVVAVLDPIVTAWGDADIPFADGLSLEATMRRVGRWLEKRRDIVTDRLREYRQTAPA